MEILKGLDGHISSVVLLFNIMIFELRGASRAFGLLNLENGVKFTKKATTGNSGYPSYHPHPASPYTGKCPGETQY